MYCPRCGTENEQGDRFCANCGASLRSPKEPAERLSARERVAGVIGSTRRAQLLTVGTAIAIVIVVIATLTLAADDEGIPRDSYTVAADRICVEAKKQIGAAGNRALAGQPSDAPAAYARSLVPLVAQWRVDFNALHAPPDRVEQANALSEALHAVEIQASALALAAEDGAPDLSEQAQHVDQLTEDVEQAIADLGLTDCSRISIAPRAPPNG